MLTPVDQMGDAVNSLNPISDKNGVEIVQQLLQFDADSKIQEKVEVLDENFLGSKRNMEDLQSKLRLAKRKIRFMATWQKKRERELKKLKKNVYKLVMSADSFESIYVTSLRSGAEGCSLSIVQYRTDRLR